MSCVINGTAINGSAINRTLSEITGATFTLRYALRDFLKDFGNTNTVSTATPFAMKWRGLVLAIALCGAGGVAAQDGRGQLSNIERDITALNQQIATKQQLIATLRNRPSPEQSELKAAQKVLGEARAAFQANATPENESKAKNAEFKVKLAEIKYDKAHADVNALVDDVEQLKSQVANKQREAKEASKQAAEQQVASDRQQQQKASDELAKRRQQEQELVRSRQEAEAQQKEIAHLKAALAAKEATTAKTATPPVALPVTPTVANKAAAEPVATAKPATATPTQAGGGALKLISQQEVAQELQQLEQRLARPGPERGANDALYLKRPNAKVTNKDKVVLRALGKEQYRGQTTVEPGQYQISVGFNQWPLEFSASEVGQTVFLYDNSDPHKARLFIYNSALEK